VLVNMAPSLDGKIAPARKYGPLSMSRGKEDGQRMLALRARADAVVIGASNLRVDDPDLAPGRLRVVVTRSGEHVLPSAKMFGAALGGEAVVAHAATMPEERRATLRSCATLVELGHTQVEPLRLLEWLERERGCRVVLCEGGGVLNAALFAARAVDELYLTLVPRILGGTSAPSLVGGDGFEADSLPDGRLRSCEQNGDDLFLVYEFIWPARP
jgi:2,5-diamino-6-(ribosylamino)-4(3H)-pyrimidinone 5'-phosphate reductase